MKYVIITGGIFPRISARSFRSTELAKGLAKQGHDVTLYANLGSYDYSEFEKEYNIRVKNLGRFYWGNANSDGVSHLNLLQRVLRRLLRNVIDYPWCEYFFKTINTLKKEKTFDYLITIAHPYGIHWGAAYYRKYISKDKFKFWASDCGDPLLGNPVEHYWKATIGPLERLWGEQTDKIVVPVESAKEGYDKRFRDKIAVIPQSIDFSSVEISKYVVNKVPTFLYSGAIYPGMRDPSKFMEYLCTLKTDFCFHIYITGTFMEKYKTILGDKLVLHPYIPRKELLLEMSRMDFLININNKSRVQTPSKLIDYGLSKRPFMSISTDLTQNEKDIFMEFLQKNYTRQSRVENLEQYDSKSVCKKFSDLCLNSNDF